MSQRPSTHRKPARSPARSPGSPELVASPAPRRKRSAAPGGLHHSPLHLAPPKREHAPFRKLHFFEPLIALVLFCLALGWGLGLAQSLRRPLSGAELWPRHAPAITPQDSDGDGLPDAEEDALLARYSPLGLISGDEPCLPANIGWIRAHAGLLATGVDVMGTLASPKSFATSVRHGSDDPADWTMYGHAFTRADGGVELQYWFYFPYNEGPLFFDHDSDWEHVSVELRPDRTPESFALSAHNDNAPGRRVPFDSVPRRGGTHPWFVIAAGTHAAYLHADDAPFWEKTRDCPRGDDGQPLLGQCAVQVWSAGDDAGPHGSPLVNVGERRSPRTGPALDAFFMDYPGMWGAALPLLGSAAPYGPPYQRGFCVGAKPGTCR